MSPPLLLLAHDFEVQQLVLVVLLQLAYCYETAQAIQNGGSFRHREGDRILNRKWRDAGRQLACPSFSV